MLTPISGTEWLTRALPPVHHIVYPWLTEGAIAMIYGPAGVSKTNVTLDLALAIGDGTGFLNFDVPRARRVLYVDAEMQRTTVQSRLQKFHNHTPRLRGFANLWPMNYADVGGIANLAMPEAGGRDLINQALHLWQAEVLILDNKSSLMSGDENSAEAFQSFSGWLLNIRAQGITTILVHHAGKKRPDGTLSQRGTSRVVDVMDCTVQLDGRAKAKDGVIPVHWTFEKKRGFTPSDEYPEEFDLNVHYDDRAKLAWLDLAEEPGKEAPEWVGAAQRLQGAGMSLRDIGGQLGVGHATVKRWLDKARALETPAPSGNGGSAKRTP